MAAQRGLFDPDERYAALSKAGDPLERLAGGIDFELFRPELDATLDRSDGRQGGRPPMEPDRIIRFYNQRGTAERHVEEGRQVINWTRLSCKGMAWNEVRLQLHASACNPSVFLQGTDLPEEMADRPADPPHQDRSAGRPPRPSRHVPTGRGSCRRRSVHPHPCVHPTAPCATGTGQRHRYRPALPT